MLVVVIVVIIITIIAGQIKTVLSCFEMKYRKWRSVKVSNQTGPSRPQNYLDLLEHLEETWKQEEIRCHSNYSEKPVVVGKIHIIKNTRK